MRCTFILLELGALLLAGCSPEWYRENADTEVYDIVDQKRKPLISRERQEIAFTIERRLVSVGEVGTEGKLEDFRRTPPPDPEEDSVDVDELLEDYDREQTPEDSTEGSFPRADSPEGAEDDPTASAADASDDGADDGADDGPPSDPPSDDGADAVSAEPQAPDDAAQNRANGAASDATGDDPAVEDGPPDSRPEAAEESEAGQPDASEDAAGEVPGGPDGEVLEDGDDGVSIAATIADMLARTPTIPARVLSLDDALQLAFANNRDYQTQKEAVYLQVLTLTLVRWQFAPRFFGIITGDWNTDSDGTESGRVNSRFGFTQLFASGARLSISVLNNFFQFFTGDRDETANTILDGSITQPLLRGFGGTIVLEPLTQSERNSVYQLRTFERFRKTFAFSVVSEYYRVVQDIDTVHNAYLNWQFQVDNLERSEAMEEAQRLARLQVDQVRNAELQAHDSWISAVTSYENSLDRFKITLGIDVETSIALDPEELTKLEDATVAMLDISVDDAIGLAFEYRLDLETARQQVEDAERNVGVAADLLRAQLDVTGAASLESGDGDAQTPLKFNTANLAYGVGVDLDLPLDRKAERNAYVRALISENREKRDFTLFEDEIILTVRDEYRILEREIIRYGIQRASLQLNEIRVASTTALRDAGRALTTDVLLAQEDLNGARNDLTGAIVNFTLARLALYRDLGVLQVNSGNRIVEPSLAALIARSKQKAEEERGNLEGGDVTSTLLTSSGKDPTGVAR